MITGIYTIRCLIDGKFYVGRAINFKQRWKVHSSHLRLNKHTNVLLQNAYNKYGKEYFAFEILEYCEKNELVEREQWWIDNSKCCDKNVGYNLNPSAENSSGFKHTLECIEKIRANSIRLGLKPPLATGRKHTDETKLKQSLSKLGKPKSEQHKANMRGKVRSEQHRKNISLAKVGFKHTKESRLKISIAGKELDKWPHEKGNKCTCRECKDKKTLYYRNKRAQSKTSPTLSIVEPKVKKKNEKIKFKRTSSTINSTKQNLC